MGVEWVLRFWQATAAGNQAIHIANRRIANPIITLQHFTTQPAPCTFNIPNADFYRFPLFAPQTFSRGRLPMKRQTLLTFFVNCGEKLRMSAVLEQIQAPIAEELAEFEKHFRTAIRTRVALLDKVMQYVLRRKGKQMRPMFVFLSAGTLGEINPAAYRAAALIELLHTATLIHDDVVDDADERRSFFSLNALWKNKIAVLVGDFLLSRGLLTALEAEDFRLLKIVSTAVKMMSEGELLQMEKARTLNIDEPVYFEIIRYKTASLIAACCEAGAAAAGAPDDVVERMRLFGENVGMAFQIKDDLFDYGGAQAGKPAGLDLKEKKLTLPLIHVLNQSSWSERRKMIQIVKNYNTDAQKTRWLVNFVRERGGIEYSVKTMNRYMDTAMSLLLTFPENPSRNSLRDLVQFTVTRNN
jgi:octaprenyl-diphosphate synthase